MCRDFDWEQELCLLAEDVENVAQTTILRFAESDLSNEFFLRQFEKSADKPFSEKKYWRSFARVLVSRGINEIKDVQTKMLVWLQDINWPGSDLIFGFVMENITAFRQALKESLSEALRDDDEAWINSLLTVLYKSKGLSDKEIGRKLSNVRKCRAATIDANKVSETIDEIIG